VTERVNVKAWLLRANHIEGEVKGLLDAAREERERVTNIVQQFSWVGVQSSPDPHKFDRLAELEALVEAKVAELQKVKAETIQAVMKVDSSLYREILVARYVRGLTMEQIAVQTHYSWRQTCRLHGRALLKMEEVLNGRS